MDMSGSERIEAPVETVWQALNDPEILRQAIPGCESLDKTSDTTMTAKVVLKVGPIKAKFEGAVELQNLNPPFSYTIAGEGKGGLAGFAKGGADVSLAADGADATILTYTVKAEVGGKIAQLGSRLIDSTSKKLAGEFFSKFGTIVAGGGEPASA
ncbi:MAG: carbon monoxide dehydrogenase subunit G [Rhizobium sp.]|nr:carbon monoxide dehydrogenase subunit G [Rhizobium sp.]